MVAWSAFCVALSTNLTSDLSLPAPSNVHGLADPLDTELLPPAPSVHLAALDLMDNPIMDGKRTLQPVRQLGLITQLYQTVLSSYVTS